MTSTAEQITLTLKQSSELSSQFSIDIGNSCCKVVCVQKCRQPHTEASSTLSYATFNGTQISDDVIKFIKANCETNHQIKESQVFTCTGFHVRNANKQRLKDEFGFSDFRLLSEIDCSITGLEFFLRQVPECDAFHPMAQDAIAEATSNGEHMVKVQATFANKTDNIDKSEETAAVQGIQEKVKKTLSTSVLTERVQNVYPYIVLQCGSACLMTLVESEKDFRIIEGSASGGKLFLALGKLLLGESDYGKIMELAEQGDESKVSVFQRDLKAQISDGEKDSYVDIPEEILLFSLGKTLDSQQEYSKADLARGLVHMAAENLALGAFWTASATNSNHIFMTGGLMSHRLMRDAIMQHFLKRCYFVKKVLEMHFLRYSSYLCVTGALFKD